MFHCSPSVLSHAPAHACEWRPSQAPAHACECRRVDPNPDAFASGIGRASKDCIAPHLLVQQRSGRSAMVRSHGTCASICVPVVKATAKTAAPM